MCKSIGRYVGCTHHHTKTDSVGQTVDVSAFRGGQYTDKQTARCHTDASKTK